MTTKTLLLLSLFGSVAIGALAACSSKSPSGREPVGAEVAPDRAGELFAAMRAGTFDDRTFPTLTWDDIPALLARGDSRRELGHFPRNPLSSQFEERCSEGMVALWLLEGVRKGGRHASLNALCFAGLVEGADWTAASAANHERVLAAYQNWWARVRDLPRDEALAVDPLAGTGLHWY